MKIREIIEGVRPIDALNVRGDAIPYTKKIGQVISLTNKISKDLPAGIEAALETWGYGVIGQNNPLENQTVVSQLSQYFAPVRELLKQLFGSHITLYRGEIDRTSDVGRENKLLYSWSADPGTAAEYARHYVKIDEFTDGDITRAIQQYNKTGYAKFAYYFLARLKEDPEYFNLYQNRELIGEFHNDEILDTLEEIQHTAKQHNLSRKNNGTVYKKSISIDDIVWIGNAANYKELEFIVKGDKIK
jgi:hypothetical protein